MSMKKKELLKGILSAGLVLSGCALAPAFAADHRDNLLVDAFPEGDLTDVFAFVDPREPSNTILMGVVNPFLNPNEGPSARFAEDFLYQFKIDNDQGNGALEDKVVQFVFNGGNDLQGYDVRIGNRSQGPANNTQLPASASICSNDRVDLSYAGEGAQQVPQADLFIGDGAPGVKCYAGVRDDSFQTDVAQAVFRVGLNPDPTENAPNHTQDVWRGFADSQGFGPIRGRQVRADGTSGVDGFGGYNTTVFAVSVPSSMLTGGSGVFDPSGIVSDSAEVEDEGTTRSGLIGVWGTVSRPEVERFDGYNVTYGNKYDQFERMGQQLTNTVFIFNAQPFNQEKLTWGDIAACDGRGFGQDPGAELETSELKLIYNALGPECDNELFRRYIPGSLTQTPTPGSANNTQSGRNTLLTGGGFISATGVTGVPSLTQTIGLANQNRHALAQWITPDYLRLDVNVVPQGVRNGAATGGNSASDLSVFQWGLQNGRRPADDVTDILLRACRELCDVQFPDLLVTSTPLDPFIGGASGLIPGAGPVGDRNSVDCTNLSVDADNPQALLPCNDSRVFLVLQGTDFIESSPADINNVANQVANERPLPDEFPYIGVNPVPGESGTTNFPPQSDGAGAAGSNTGTLIDNTLGGGLF